ncbi:MAG: hypothetical protein H7839_08320, partial [Magnetococcus sp. YQC-5]
SASISPGERTMLKITTIRIRTNAIQNTQTRYQTDRLPPGGRRDRRPRRHLRDQRKTHSTQAFGQTTTAIL